MGSAELGILVVVAAWVTIGWVLVREVRSRLAMSRHDEDESQRQTEEALRLMLSSGAIRADDRRRIS